MGDNVIRHIRFACWLSNTTDSRSECEMFVTFRRQKLLRERASVLRLYVHCLSFYVISTFRSAQPNIKLRVF